MPVSAGPQSRPEPVLLSLLGFASMRDTIRWRASNTPRDPTCNRPENNTDRVPEVLGRLPLRPDDRAGVDPLLFGPDRVMALLARHFRTDPGERCTCIASGGTRRRRAVACVVPGHAPPCAFPLAGQWRGGGAGGRGAAPGGGKPLGGPKVRPVYPLRPVRRNRTDSSVLAPSLTGALPRNGYGVTRTARGAVTKSPCPVPTAPCASSNTAPVSPWATPRTRPPNSPGVSCSKAAMDPSVTSTSK